MNCKRTLLALLIIAGVCAVVFLQTGEAPSSAAAGPRAGTYVGPLEGLIDVIGIDVTHPDAKNRRIVRAYLCDGEPGGDARWYSGVMVGNKVRLVSTDAETTLEVKLGHDAASGSVTFEDGSVHRFIAPPAVGGGGVYEIEATPDGVAHGVSLAGDTLIATKSAERVSDIGDGRPWEVTVTTVSGETFQYLHYDLGTLSVEELAQLGFPASYATGGGPPGPYTVVWLVGNNPLLPGVNGFFCGRSGDVKAGKPGTNIWGIFEPA